MFLKYGDLRKQFREEPCYLPIQTPRTEERLEKVTTEEERLSVKPREIHITCVTRDTGSALRKGFLRNAVAEDT